MKKETKITLDVIVTQLRALQDIVIGVYKLPYLGNKTIECVVEEDEHTFTTVNIGSLLGMSTTIHPKPEHSFVKFPSTMVLTEMMENPMIFDQWMRENLK